MSLACSAPWVGDERYGKRGYQRYRGGSAARARAASGREDDSDAGVESRTERAISSTSASARSNMSEHLSAKSLAWDGWIRYIPMTSLVANQCSTPTGISRLSRNKLRCDSERARATSRVIVAERAGRTCSPESRNDLGYAHRFDRSRSHAATRNRTQQCPCSPEFFRQTTTRPRRRSGKHSAVSSAISIAPETSSNGSVITSRKAPPQNHHFDLNETINDAIGLARSAIAGHKVSLHTHFAEKLPPVQGDRIQLQQVLLNLVLNAVEAMDAVKAEARELSISTEPTETKGVLVTVCDSGARHRTGKSGACFRGVLYYKVQRNGDRAGDLPVHHRSSWGPAVGRGERTSRGRISVYSAQRRKLMNFLRRRR